MRVLVHQMNCLNWMTLVIKAYTYLC